MKSSIESEVQYVTVSSFLSLPLRRRKGGYTSVASPVQPVFTDDLLCASLCAAPSNCINSHPEGSHTHVKL